MLGQDLAALHDAADADVGEREAQVIGGQQDVRLIGEVADHRGVEPRAEPDLRVALREIQPEQRRIAHGHADRARSRLRVAVIGHHGEARRAREAGVRPEQHLRTVTRQARRAMLRGHDAHAERIAFGVGQER